MTQANRPHRGQGRSGALGGWLASSSATWTVGSDDRGPAPSGGRRAAVRGVRQPPPPPVHRPLPPLQRNPRRGGRTASGTAAGAVAHRHPALRRQRDDHLGRRAGPRPLPAPDPRHRRHPGLRLALRRSRVRNTPPRTLAQLAGGGTRRHPRLPARQVEAHHQPGRAPTTRRRGPVRHRPSRGRPRYIPRGMARVAPPRRGSAPRAGRTAVVATDGPTAHQPLLERAPRASAARRRLDARRRSQRPARRHRHRASSDLSSDAPIGLQAVSRE